MRPAGKQAVILVFYCSSGIECGENRGKQQGFSGR